ncbi:hydroxymethylbilane synthase [Stetteria hydrogenophila]
MHLRVATRGSRLSLEQVRIAMEYLKSRIPGLTYEVVVVKTLGDRVQDRPLHLLGRKGVFEKEVNLAVLEGRADVAVHSMKDLPSEMAEELDLLAVPPREAPNEALVPRRGLEPRDPEGLPPGSVVAAGSPRRRAMILNANPGVKPVIVRGNLDTRLRKLDSGAADYLLAAEAGLRRLGVDRPRVVLPLIPYTPPPGQGVIAVVGLRDWSGARALREASHKPTEAEAVAERVFLERLQAGCSTPVGGVSRLSGGALRFHVSAFSPDGSRGAWATLWGRDPAELGEEAASVARTLLSEVTGG